MATTKIVNHIRRLRFEHGEMSQQDLAYRVRVSRQTIVAIEGAKYSPTLELAFEIARVFRRPLSGCLSTTRHPAESTNP
jgi:putative transcriptional regulator